MGKNSPFFRFLASKMGLGQALPLEVEVTVDPGTGILTPSPALTSNKQSDDFFFSLASLFPL